MLDAYHALNQAVSRPMRRWWLRNGIWWLAAIVLLGVLDACIRGLLLPHLQEQSWTASASGGGVRLASMFGLRLDTWVMLSRLPVAVSRALTMYAWLLAAMHVAGQVAVLTRDIPYPAANVPRRLCFLLALQAGWPYVIIWVINTSGILVLTLYRLFGPRALPDGNDVYHLQAAAFHGEPWASLTGMMLMLVLMVVSNTGALQVWLWTAALAWAPVAGWIYSCIAVTAGRHHAGFAVMDLSMIDPPRWEWGYSWAVSAILMLLILRSYATHRTILGHILLSVMLVSMILNRFGDWLPWLSAQPGSSKRQVAVYNSSCGVIIGVLRSMSDFPCSAMIDYQPFEHTYTDEIAAQSKLAMSANGALHFYAPVRIFVIAPTWAGYLVAPVNVLYLVLLIILLMYAGFHTTPPERSSSHA